MKTACVAGPTGLIGAQLLVLLLQDGRYDVVIAVSRTPLPEHPKLRNVMVADFQDIADRQDQLVADDVFCCLGTTMKKAGSRPAFQRVDLEYVRLLGRVSRENGTRQFMLVSSLGADKSSPIFYNKIKGLAEEAVLGFGFETVHILRPSLLLGHRTEHRTAEEAAKKTYRIFDFMIPVKYKAIDSAHVASALLTLAKDEKPGIFIHESASLKALVTDQ